MIFRFFQIKVSYCQIFLYKHMKWFEVDIDHYFVFSAFSIMFYFLLVFRLRTGSDKDDNTSRTSARPTPPGQTATR